MITSIRSSLLLLLLLGLCVPQAEAQLTKEIAFTNLAFDLITDIASPPDGTDRIFVLERRGYIYVFPNDPNVASATLFGDFTSLIYCCREETGLTGIAFHPDYANNGYFYITYTAREPSLLTSGLSRFTVSAANPNAVDLSSEVKLINHREFNNVHIISEPVFGPDGYLYVGLGDGGPQGDPENHAQDLTDFNGKILRIDVDGGGSAADCGTTHGAGNYTIPTTNPFHDGVGGNCDEIWAYGFRNPWRFDFAPNGELWVGDVGQDAWEEVDIVEGGKNYGWKIMEGNHCHDPATGCSTTGLELPIYEYPHPDGLSIIGGHTYAGVGCPQLQGQYIYSDFVSGVISSLTYDGTLPPTQATIIPETFRHPTTFGWDQNGELYFSHYAQNPPPSPSSDPGQIFKIGNCPSAIVANLKVMLAGPYNPTTNLMKTDMVASKVLPAGHPFGDATFDGTPTEYDENTGVHWDFFGSHPDMVDWVLLELRTGTSAATAVAKRAALLRNDGRITDFDGSSPVAFPGIGSGNYYAAVWHRNHLGIMTKNAISLNLNSTLYDFTTAQSKAFGTNPMLELETGVFGMYGGDGNAIDGVTAFDFLNIWLPQNGTVGYLQGDFNLSGDATAFDFLTVWLPGNGQASWVPE